MTRFKKTILIFMIIILSGGMVRGENAKAGELPSQIANVHYQVQEPFYGNLVTSEKGIEFIKRQEGFRANAYYCCAGVATIGYGTTNNKYVCYGTCSKEQADKWLRTEIKALEHEINKRLRENKRTISQCKFDALVSFGINVGSGGLFKSNLWKNTINSINETQIIAANFMAWNKANGRVVQGLTERRIKETNLYLYGQY